MSTENQRVDALLANVQTVCQQQNARKHAGIWPVGADVSVHLAGGGESTNEDARLLLIFSE